MTGPHRAPYNSCMRSAEPVEAGSRETVFRAGKNENLPFGRDFSSYGLEKITVDAVK